MSENKEQTLKFNEDYRQFECLCNTKLKTYSNKKVRNYGLGELDSKYGLSGGKGVKNKIKCLRSYFAKKHEKTQKKPSGSGAGEVYSCTWFAYKDLLFLKDTSNSHNTQDTSQHSDTQDTSQHSGTQDMSQDNREDAEALRQRELEEARARATQMEKTMRWWSDCTANWREKWSKVRNERNKAREEAKLLRSKLEASLKETNCFKREKLELESQNDQLKKEMEKIHMLLLKHAGQWDQHFLEALEKDDPDRDEINKCKSPEEDSGVGSTVTQDNSSSLRATTQLAVSSVSADLYGLREVSLLDSELSIHSRDLSIEEYVLQGAVPKHAVELYDGAKENAVDRDGGEDAAIVNSDILMLYDEVTQGLNRSCLLQDAPTSMSGLLTLEKKFYLQPDVDLPSPDQEQLLQKLSMLQLRLDEASKTLQAERDEKTSLHRGLQRLQGELQETRERCEGLRAAKQEAVRELLHLQDQHQDQVRLIQLDLQDEASSREGTDRRLADLRSELERLQAENAAEWGKRERLETEKLALERDNKKLRAELRDLQERLERKGRPLSTSDADLRQLQQELVDRNKELSDLRHSHAKLKKVLQDKSTELAHAVRRAEQYEAEVKRLRGRVEELKKELAAAEDEVDGASNSIRKLQRTNDELQEHVESLQVQLEHLQTRLRTSSCSTLLSHRAPPRLAGEASDDDVHNY